MDPGDCQAAPGFRSLLINALENLGITERPRYYRREYEHHGTLRCRVILVIARSDRYPDILPWRVTATGFRHQDTYPLAIRKALRYLCRIFRKTHRPHTNEVLSAGHQNPSLGSSNEESGTTPP